MQSAFDSWTNRSLNAAPSSGKVACLIVPADTPSFGRLQLLGHWQSRLLYRLEQPPDKGILNLSENGDFCFIPQNGVLGLDRFIVRIEDRAGSLVENVTGSMFIGGVARIMPLGDSITLGTHNATSPVSGRFVGYRRKLYDDLVLRSSGTFRIEFVGSQVEGYDADPPVSDPRHEGHGGWSLAQIASNVARWLTTNPPDIVLIHAGTNEFAPSATALGALLDNIARWEQQNYRLWTFVARIIQAVDGSLDVETYNNQVEAMIENRRNNRLFVVDQQKGAGLRYSVGADMADNLHPTQSGYDKMAARWCADLVGSGVLPNCGGVIRYSASTRR